MTKARKLRELLAQDGAQMAPCAYDALTARMIEKAGFSLAGTTGWGLHGVLLGVPDAGLLSFSEIVDAYRKMAMAVDIPIIADADGGYGSAMNVMRTVQEFEAAGLAGLFIEDQKFPPNCPYVKEVEIISAKEMTGKIEAAVAARKDKDFVIVARTDAPFEEAVERCQMYFDAGADMVKVVPMTRWQLENFPLHVKGGPIHVGFTSPDKNVNPGLTIKDFSDMGYKVATYPFSLLFAEVKAVEALLNTIKETGTDEGFKDNMVSIDEYFELVGHAQFTELTNRYVRN